MAVLLIGGGIAFSQPALRNQICLTFLSPKSYYIRTEYKNVKNIAESIGNSYEKRVKRLNSQKDGTKKNEMTIKFDLNKSLTSELGIDDILPIEFLVDSRSNMEKGKKQMGMECKIGQEKFIGLDMLMNLGQEGYGDTYIQIPQFSDAYLYTGIQETNKEDAEFQKDMDRYQKIYTNYLNNPTSKKFLSNLIVRYGKLIFETPEEISIEKKAEYSVNNVKKNMTKVTVSITAADTKAWCNKILETAKDDKELKNEMIRLGICEEESYPELIKKMEDILEGEEDNSEKLVMDVWVDNKGNIVGREIFVTANDKKENGFYYFTDNQEGTDYLELAFYSQENEDTSIIIKGSRKQEETGYKGEAVLEKRNGNKVENTGKLTFAGVTLVDKNYNTYNGDFTFKVGSLVDGKLQVTLDGEENKQNIRMEAVIDGENIGFIEIKQSIQDCEEIVYPPKGTIYDTQKTEDMQEYMASMDPTELSKLQERVNTIAAVVGSVSGNSQIGDILPDILSSEENKKEDENTEEENTSQTNNNKGIYIIKEAPKTKDDLPENVEVDEYDFYTYEVSDEMVKENGEASNAEPIFHGVTMDKNESKIEEVVKSVFKKNYYKNTESRNAIYGSIGEYASLNTSFLTTDSWHVEDDADYILDVSYDTYSNEISQVIIRTKNGNEMDKMVKDFLTLWEEDADKSYKEYEKQAKKVKNGDSESFDAGGTRIYYSPDKNEVYCALSAKED
ncbi:MAG: hypothetical protein HDT30_00390 [Clostridiales bacterium]|nr:hypothetical protein [Clostridiales bacterium]